MHLPERFSFSPLYVWNLQSVDFTSSFRIIITQECCQQFQSHSHFGRLRRPMLALRVMNLFGTDISLYVNLHRAKVFGTDISLYVKLYRANVFGTDIFLYVNLYRVKMFGTDIFLYMNLYRAKMFGTDIFLYVNLYRVKAFGTDICLGQTSVRKKKYFAKLFYICIYLAANNFIWAPMMQGFQICSQF